MSSAQKTLIIGAGPVGALAALYAASRGDEVEVYELRGGESYIGSYLSNLSTSGSHFSGSLLCLFILVYNNSDYGQTYEMPPRFHSTSPNPSIWLYPNAASILLERQTVQVL
jgi:hypothetical protein